MHGSFHSGSFLSCSVSLAKVIWALSVKVVKKKWYVRDLKSGKEGSSHQHSVFRVREQVRLNNSPSSFKTLLSRRYVLEKNASFPLFRSLTTFS